jgi:hypothetical protein
MSYQDESWIVALSRARENARWQAEERRRREAERERRRVETVNSYKASFMAEMEREISEIEDNAVKSSLRKEMRDLRASLGLDSRAERWRSVSDVRGTAADIRRHIRDAQREKAREKQVLVNIAEYFEKAESSKAFEQFSGLRRYYVKLKNDVAKSKSGIVSQDERIAVLAGLKSELDTLIKRAQRAYEMNVDIKEINADLEPFIMTLEKRRASENAKLRDEITGYFEYMRQFDSDRADTIKREFDIAMLTDDHLHLHNLRITIHNAYTQLKGEVNRTMFFRSELSEPLPVLKENSASAALAREIEDMINPAKRKYISREEYLYANKKIVDFFYFAEKEETNDFSRLARITKETLVSLGYQIAGEDPRKPFASGEIRYFDSPEDDYRVELSLDSGKIRSSLVRVDDAQSAASEVDEVTAKKWCSHMKILHGAYETAGFDLQNMTRKEPERGTVLEKKADARKAVVNKAKRKKKADEQQKLQRHNLG